MTDVTEGHEMSLSSELVQVLSDKQLLAVLRLARGAKVVDVAAELDVARETVSRWRSEDAFRCALNAARLELWDDARNRLRALVGGAVDVLADELENKPRVSTAIAILKCIGVHGAVGGAPRGPVSLREVEREKKRAESDAVLQDFLATY